MGRSRPWPTTARGASCRGDEALIRCGRLPAVQHIQACPKASLLPIDPNRSRLGLLLAVHTCHRYTLVSGESVVGCGDHAVWLGRPRLSHGKVGHSGSDFGQQAPVLRLISKSDNPPDSADGLMRSTLQRFQRRLSPPAVPSRPYRDHRSCVVQLLVCPENLRLN